MGLLHTLRGDRLWLALDLIEEFRPVIEAQIKAWAASVGRRHGFEYAEEFRRVRFGDMERWARRSGEELAEDV